MNKRLLVLGGGIKGTAVAAVASLLEFDVTLVEKGWIGSGTTSTNHGRLHLGSAGWKRDDSDLIRRRRAASELMRALPDVLTPPCNAYYCFEDSDDADTFLKVITACGIDHAEVNPDIPGNAWLDQTFCNRVFEVPEYSFNPALLAGRFAQTCAAQGGAILTGRAATRLEVRHNRPVVILSDGSEIDTDLVINTMSRWCGELVIPAGAPRFDVQWFRWRLLCLQLQKLGRVGSPDRVIVVTDRAGMTPSVIPHGEWVTLDYSSTRLEQLDHPDGDTVTDWKQFDTANTNDIENFNAVRTAFPPIREFAAQGNLSGLYSMAGVQGRLAGVKPGSTNQCLTSDDCRGYVATFGGQASTALLDALDIMDFLAGQRLCRQVNHTELVIALTQSLSPVPIPGYLPMRWEQQI